MSMRPSKQRQPPTTGDLAPQDRRKTAVYRAKQQLVTRVWLGAGVVMLIQPILPLVLIIGLLTTFIAFIILDETPQENPE